MIGAEDFRSSVQSNIRLDDDFKKEHQNKTEDELNKN
jgi:hypothetical protein